MWTNKTTTSITSFKDPEWFMATEYIPIRRIDLVIFTFELIGWFDFAVVILSY
jgi:hypothetical protein